MSVISDPSTGDPAFGRLNKIYKIYNFRHLLQDLRTSDSFDHVIIDTPPILAVADPLIVAEQVDGVLLVVQGGETPRQSVVAGIEKLRSAKTQILGAVINNLPLVDQDSYAYRYGYRYSYYTHPESEMMPGDDRSGDRAAGGQGGSS